MSNLKSAKKGPNINNKKKLNLNYCVENTFINISIFSFISFYIIFFVSLSFFITLLIIFMTFFFYFFFPSCLIYLKWRGHLLFSYHKYDICIIGKLFFFHRFANILAFKLTMYDFYSSTHNM